MLSKPLAVSIQDIDDSARDEGTESIEEEDLQNGKTWQEMLENAEQKQSANKKCCIL